MADVLESATRHRLHDPEEETLTSLREGVLHRMEPGGTSLLFDTATGDVHTMNATGTIAIQRLLAGATADEAADTLAAEFEVSVEVARADIETLIIDLQAGKFLASHQ